jgi:hypothetical protein
MNSWSTFLFILPAGGLRRGGPGKTKERLEGCIKLLPVASNKSEHGGWWQYLELPCVCAEDALPSLQLCKCKPARQAHQGGVQSANSTLKYLRLVKV